MSWRWDLDLLPAVLTWDEVLMFDAGIEFFSPARAINARKSPSLVYALAPDRPRLID
jgi:hypothetical protein